MSSFSRRSWVEVSRARIAANFRAVRGAVGPGVEVMPVVKADAYRHGAGEVSRVLEDAGARWLAVSSVEEGIALRQAGVGAGVVVMAGVLPAEWEAVHEFALTPVIHSLDELKAPGRFRYHLKIDSGLGRLGTRAACDEILNAVRRSGPERLEGVMSHYASPADFSSPQTGEQTDAFLRIYNGLKQAGLKPRYVHLSSTNAVAYGRRAACETMVRPGHAIYGYVSPARGQAPQRLVSVQPALAWKAAVIAVKDLPEGARIGYGAIYQAPRPTRTAVLAVGYADGYPHRLTNRGKVIVKGHFAPLLGAVSMDLTTIDVTDCPPVAPGDAVTLLGQEGEASLDAIEMARMAGTISYGVLCGISARVKRVYV